MPNVPVALATGMLVKFVATPDAGVPRAGVTRVGELANTAAPLPVSSGSAAARLADVGVPRKLATPVPSPETPVEIGSPVAFVKMPDAGVPSAGVVKIGDVSVLFVRVCGAEFAVSVSLVAGRLSVKLVAVLLLLAKVVVPVDEP